MDPNACFQLILNALETHDTDEVREHADDLRNWLRRGGFMPTIQPHELEFLLTCLAIDARHAHETPPPPNPNPTASCS